MLIEQFNLFARNTKVTHEFGSFLAFFSNNNFTILEKDLGSMT
jgi:hypothetical protein